MNCPSCGGEMTATTLPGHVGTTITIDSCTACQSFWFDNYESLQLPPASTLTLFGFIGEHSATGRATSAKILRCPRCRRRLLPTNDRQRDTPFQYWRCDEKHGRFITFFNFLREKSFIRTLSPMQLEELRQHIQIVNCSNCGAPIDLIGGSACTHCGSPVSMLDMKQAGRLVSELRNAAEPKKVDPVTLPLELARARREVEASFAAFDADREWWTDASTSGLVEAGLHTVARWLKRE